MLTSLLRILLFFSKFLFEVVSLLECEDSLQRLSRMFRGCWEDVAGVTAGPALDSGSEPAPALPPTSDTESWVLGSTARPAPGPGQGLFSKLKLRV